ncbi:PGF-CTERM-anchored ABC transporter substrate-binding protein [Natrialbaceae archaeon AArc-T1-2]|uniref:PGF-CTERM-anchored ABC transporter substrate-binding protein n=1 Tax=Natrialbaceae archaeon AArc-T1-2 TaxID=3053904 RepID=UPI00255AD3AC|nr:PGF-CTERM-anchored ABC transporter substrate-binding protein [Natrialbaceae archaeon AArc-T1-2]WIV66094.1 PGF-CTERM-anchored ABC transporter substrate-binding protein [Natrialbaceae archaeon AArc-T1-2]
MRKPLIALIATLVVVATLTPAAAAHDATPSAGDVECEYPLELTDGTGETVALEEPPERVVALMPSDARTAFEIGAEDVVVGMPITDATADLAVGDRTDVTEDDGFTTDVETVVGLEPDVVVAGSAASEDEIDQLRDLGLTVYHFDEAESLEDVVENVAITGQLTGDCAGATETAEWMDDRFDLLESAVEDEDHPLAYYPMGGGFTAGTETFQHEVMTTAGLENVASHAGIEGWEPISEEVVVEEDPEWIVYGDGFDEPQVSEAVHETTASQEENVVAVDDNDFSQPGPNVVFAVEEILEAVHPDAYDEISDDLAALDADYESDESDESDEAGDADDADDTTDDPVPGFAVPAAVAALLAVVAVLARRR